MNKKIFTPSPEQQDFLGWIVNGRGSAVLEAVAGAGKTTTLVEGVKLMRGTVFLGAYNKKMGEELKGRLAELNDTSKKAGTFHSAGYSALRRAAASNLEIDDKKVRGLTETHLANTDYSDDKDFIGAVCKLVSLAKQTGFLVPGLVEKVQLRYWMELVNRYDVLDSLPEDADADFLCCTGHAVLQLSNAYRDVIDFDDMVYLPLLRNLRMFKNDWVLVDEAQDTNAVRRELAARMLKPGGRLVAVGDPHQAIYGFTGADSDSLNAIKKRFNAITLKLSVSWRCPRAVVTIAREYVSHISPATTAAEGSALNMRYRDMVAAVQPGDAVVSRFNAPLVELCFRLIREGKAARIEGKAIGEGLVALVSRWKVKTIDALEVKLEKWLEREIEKVKASAKPDEAKIDRIGDTFATVKVLIDRAREKGMSKLDELKEMVLEMFADVGNSSSLIVLSSVHRSKGLEWPRVFILGRGDIMPSRRVTQEWQAEQEINLCYVAITRAQEVLVDVAMPTADEFSKKAEEKKEAA